VHGRPPDKAQFSIRPQSITGKSRLRQSRAIRRRPGGNRQEQGRVLNALQCSAGRLRRARITEDEVLEAGQRAHGLERMDEIKFAILEASGRISIIPKRKIVASDEASAPGTD
jgi:hypothetical protein